MECAPKGFHVEGWIPSASMFKGDHQRVWRSWECWPYHRANLLISIEKWWKFKQQALCFNWHLHCCDKTTWTKQGTKCLFRLTMWGYSSSCWGWCGTGVPSSWSPGINNSQEAEGNEFWCSARFLLWGQYGIQPVMVLLIFRVDLLTVNLNNLSRI